MLCRILPICSISIHDGIVGHDGIMVHDSIVGHGGASMPIKSSGRIVPPGWALLQPKQSVLSLIV